MFFIVEVRLWSRLGTLAMKNIVKVANPLSFSFSVIHSELFIFSASAPLGNLFQLKRKNLLAVRLSLAFLRSAAERGNGCRGKNDSVRI
ncbi:hypothetical protein J2Z66_005165 [Paenibacillus eucommiae]|uniref:Uncharacterized protein n=1 Tax=Paenibacillus eucommiae TaxID=1355755 RepID=A0ABS4J135_9BACL|nr:hypothetical protein [Paenibacillus eucommiae]